MEEIQDLTMPGSGPGEAQLERPVPPSEDGLKGKFVHGVFWKGVAQVIAQLSGFIAIAVLARLLAPSQFGLVGMAAILTGLILQIGEVGLGNAVIHMKDPQDADLSSVFWASIALGFVSWGAACVAAPLFARLFHQQAVIPIVVVTSFAFVISSFGVVQRTLLTRGLDFKKLSYADITEGCVYAVVAIGLALAGLGVWSLVLAGLCQLAASVVLLWVISPWRPKMVFSWTRLTRLLSYGMNVLGFRLVNYARETVDYFFVGRLLGPAQLGYYTMGYNLANIPRTKLSALIGEVTFPAFAQIQDDDAKLRTGYLKITRYISLASFPLLAGLVVLASEFVLVVYGDKWTPVIRPLQILCGAGIVYSVATTCGSVFLAKGRPDIQFKLSIASIVTLATFVFVGVRFGIVGVATAVLVYSLIFFWVNQVFANKLIDLKMWHFLRAMGPATAGCIAMCAVLVPLRMVQAGPMAMSRAMILLVDVPLGAVVYVGVLLLLRTPELREGLELCAGLWRSFGLGRPLARLRPTRVPASADRGE